MAIQQEPLKNDIWLVRADGRLDQSQTPLLEAALNQLLDDGRTILIVDLSQASYINSGGLRCLVSAWRRAKQQDGDVLLCGLNDRLQEVFTMVGFDKVFQIHPTLTAAQRAVKKGK
ncbi:MAG: STAS domain-containing protein [Anaerolineae bacterium]|nr:STAS domain-containing protein [Anaerolineae bacterium]